MEFMDVKTGNQLVSIAEIVIINGPSGIQISQSIQTEDSGKTLDIKNERKREMTLLSCLRIIGCLGWILITTSAVFAYEPTYNEILIQKKRLESFCKLNDNQRSYDICKRFKSLKDKLPDQISELDLFRRVQEQNPK
jgi:hypothetical protein